MTPTTAITIDEIRAEMERLASNDGADGRFTRAEIQKMMAKLGMGESASTARKFIRNAMDMGRIVLDGKKVVVGIDGIGSLRSCYRFVKKGKGK